jgi:hypothetical protein
VQGDTEADWRLGGVERELDEALDAGAELSASQYRTWLRSVLPVKSFHACHECGRLYLGADADADEVVWVPEDGPFHEQLKRLTRD